MPETQNEENTVQSASAVISPGGSITPSPTSDLSVQQAVPIISAPNREAESLASPKFLVNEFSYENRNSDQKPVVDSQRFTWTASEYVGHHKSIAWYVFFAIAAVVIIGIVFIITKDITSAIVLSIGAIILGIYAGRLPRDQQYQIDHSGFNIGPKRYEFAQFRTYSIVHEGDMDSIVFSPLKRFAPLTTIYYAPQVEDQILYLIEPVLPFEEFKHDPIDRLMRQIRF